MRPDQRFTTLDKAFWAHVRSISQELGYTERKTKEIKVPTLQNLADALSQLSLSSAHLLAKDGRPSDFARNLHGYFAYRAEVLNGLPVRTLARRVDGAFPSVINPVAIWEVKEYYHTTTFGSRVADGVYETLLDGMELED